MDHQRDCEIASTTPNNTNPIDRQRQHLSRDMGRLGMQNMVLTDRGLQGLVVGQAIEMLSDIVNVDK